MAVMLLAIWIITVITVKLNFYPGQTLNIVEVIQKLWQTGQLYFQLLVVMNFIIKPIFAYYLALVVFECIFSI